MGRLTLCYQLLLLFVVCLVNMGGSSPVDTKGKSILYGKKYYFLAIDKPSTIATHGVISDFNKRNKTFYIRSTTTTTTTTNSSSSSSSSCKKGLASAMGTPVKFLTAPTDTSTAGPDYNDNLYIQMGKQGLYWGLRREGEKYLVVLTGVRHRAKFEIVPSNICPLDTIIDQCGYTSLKTCSPNNTFCVTLDFHKVKGVNYFKIYDHITPGDAPGGVKIDLQPV